MSAWLWWARLRRAPDNFKALRMYRNWLAFLGRFSLKGHKADFIATAGNFALDHSGFTFGTLYEAQEDISIGYADGPLTRGGRYFFMGYGSLPYDGIQDYFFEAEDGTPLNLLFEPIRGSDVRAAHTKMLNDRLLRPIPCDTARARDLQTVRWVLQKLRHRNRVY